MSAFPGGATSASCPGATCRTGWISNDRDPPNATPVCVEPGTAVLFDRRLWHSPSPNTSDVTRKAVFYGYSYRWLRPRDNLKIEDYPDCHDPIRRQLLGASGDGHGYSSPQPEDVPLREWAPRPRGRRPRLSPRASTGTVKRSPSRSPRCPTDLSADGPQATRTARCCKRWRSTPNHRADGPHVLIPHPRLGKLAEPLDPALRQVDSHASSPLGKDTAPSPDSAKCVSLWDVR